MHNIKESFRKFHIAYPYLNIKEQIENFAVFEGIELEKIELKLDIFENIQNLIIDRYKELSDIQYVDTQSSIVLQKIALGDRKQYAIYRANKSISQHKGKMIYKELFKRNIIQKEKTREILPQKSKHRYLKKELRGYKAEDKIKFNKNFDRFWHTFISPFQKDLHKGYSKKCIDNIKQNFDKYVSLCFEELSNELIKEPKYDLEIVQSGGYWDRNSEFDLLAKMKNGGYILGECKWTNQKISKNILRKLQNKAKKLDFNIEKFALFSKNGFSNSLQNEKDILLFSLDDFGVLNDR